MFREELIAILLKLVQKIAEAGTLPNSFQKATITLIPNPTKTTQKRKLQANSQRSDGIPAELFQILKDDAVKVLYSICQQIGKQQWPQDWKTSVFIPISKKGNAKKCSSYHTNEFISHNSKVLLKILQAKLQQYVN